MKNLLLILTLTYALEAKVHMLTEDINMAVDVKSWIEIKNQNLTRQKHDYSCGSASLSTILTHYYKQEVIEKEILDAVMGMKGLTKNSSLEEYKKANGLSFLDLSIFAFSKGFRAMGLALDMESLKKLKIPVILYVKIRDSEHFSVLKGIDEKYAYLADPSFGNTKVKLSKFKEMFYQRDDLRHPGKILAIFPPKGETAKDISFMKVPKDSGLIADVIRSQSIKK